MSPSSLPDWDLLFGSPDAVREEYDRISYIRLTKDLKKAPRGSVRIGGRVIPGYPRVGRVFTLEPGLSHHFDSPVIAEEKIDGYNVRVFFHDGRLLALTRGGFVCPFTTDRVVDFIDPALFEAHPDLILCAEVAGPENPYNEEAPPFIPDDIALYVFDLMRKDSPEFLSHEQKFRIIDEFALPAVPVHGRFDPAQIDEIRGVMARITEKEGEGIVLKEDSARNHRAKYVTASSALDDLAITSLFLYDIPSDYAISRLIQLIFYMKENRIEITPALYESIGRALAGGCLDAFEMYAKEHRIHRTFRCRFHSETAARRMAERMKKLNPHGGVLVNSIEKEGAMWRLSFDRIYVKTTGLFGTAFGGGTIFD